jgi:hypothetical protein
VLARYWPNGELDRSVGSDGIVYSTDTSPTYGDGVAIQHDGRIVVAGSGARAHRGSSDGPASFVVFRLFADCVLIAASSGDGVFSARLGAFSIRETQALVQADGRVLVAGSAIFQAPYSDLRDVVTRFRVER